MSNRGIRGVALATLAAGTLLAGGCGGGSVPNSMNISLSDSMRASGKTVDIDVVGVNESDLGQWQSYSVDRYFAGNDPLRTAAADRKKTLVFSRESNAPQKIEKTDAIWKRWRDSASALVVMAQIPGALPSGGADARRQVLTLEKGRWKDKTFNIVVTEGGLVNNTTPAEKKD